MRTACALLIAVAAALPAGAVIIDRVAVSIERLVITESEILHQIRVTAFLNGEKPDVSSDNKRKTADRLVEQALIRREIETTRYIAPPDTTAAYDQFRKTRYPAAPEYARALQEAGLTDEDVRAAFTWQTTLLEFINVRFRPGIQINESDIRDYYDQEFAPQARAKGTAPPPYDEARNSLEEIVMSRRVDNALDRWLGQVRTQTRILYHEEAFQ